MKSIYRSIEGKRKIMELYDSLLSRWPVQSFPLTVTTCYGSTFILRCGNNLFPPLILLHGAGSNLTSWIGEISTYCKYFNVYLIDIPGEPGRSTENRLSSKTTEFAQWLHDIFENLGLKKACILGLSQGAWISLKFATCFPDQVEKLVLLSPAGIVPTKFSFILKAVFYSNSGRKGINRLNQIVFGKNSKSYEAIDYMNLILENFRSRLGKEYLFSDKELEGLTMPILFMGGSDDAVRSSEKIEARLKSKITSVKSVICQDTGHVLENVSGIALFFLRTNFLPLN
jgi:pimeloyl-ACP methyl ester carboxylesterase